MIFFGILKIRKYNQIFFEKYNLEFNFQNTKKKQNFNS